MIEFDRISKTFGSNPANHDVSFTIKDGTIHGVVGENGAGKSTIMKILYGMFPPDNGEIRRGGRIIRYANPREAIADGIGMVHQHFMLIPALTVWENIILGSEPGFWISEKRVEGLLAPLAKSYGVNFQLCDRVESLSVGQRQQVEILKLLYRNSQVLILDEPTAVLTPQETDALFERLKTLKAEGRTIVVITHKLKEVLSVTDSVTVMRRGSVVKSLPTTGISENDLAEWIMGQGFTAPPEKTQTLPNKSSPPKLIFESVSTRGGSCPLDKVSFQIYSGEIVGVAGISGNGQEALVDSIAGLAPISSGAIRLAGADGPTARRRRLGLGVIPCDRIHEGMVGEFSVMENGFLGFHREKRFYSRRILSKTALHAHANRLINLFDIRPEEPELRMDSLSGGNQQKLVVARELSHNPTLIVAAYPTRGVDIGTMHRIHRELLDRKQAGAAILLISSEIDEILTLSNRIVVIRGGRTVAEVARTHATETQLGLWMMGAA